MKIKATNKISTKLYLGGVLFISVNLLKIYGIGISDILFLLATIITFIESFLESSTEGTVWIKNPMWFPFVIFGLGAILSLHNSINPRVAVMEIFQSLYVGFLFFPLTWIMVKRGILQKIIFSLILSSLFANGVALYDKFTGSHVGAIINGGPLVGRNLRFSGPFGHPNTLGTFSIIILSIAFASIISERSFGKKVFYFIAIIFSSSGVILSGSNMAFFGAILSLSILISHLSPKKFFGFIVSSLIILLVTMPLIFATSWGHSVLVPLNRNLNRAFTTTIEARTKIYSESLSTIADSPIIGRGFDQLPTSGISDQDRLLDDFIHNVLLSVWYSGGVFSFLGLGLALIILVLIAIKSLSVFTKSQQLIGLASSSLVSILISQTEASLYRRDWWLLYGLMWAVYINIKEVEANENYPLDVLS